MKLMRKAKSKAVTLHGESDRGLKPIRHASDDIMAQLRGHQSSIESRLAAAEFAYVVIETEIAEWFTLEKQAYAKLSVATNNTRAALERLHDIAKISLSRYEARLPELEDIREKLNSTLKRINAAISVLEVDQNLRSVSNLFAVDGFEQMNFNLASEAEDIRRLCYTADAFLELEQ